MAQDLLTLAHTGALLHLDDIRILSSPSQSHIRCHAGSVEGILVREEHVLCLATHALRGKLRDG